MKQVKVVHGTNRAPVAECINKKGTTRSNQINVPPGEKQVRIDVNKSTNKKLDVCGSALVQNLENLTITAITHLKPPVAATSGESSFNMDPNRAIDCGNKKEIKNKN